MCDDSINHTTVKQDLFFLGIFALDLFQVWILLTLPWRALCGKANVQISQIERLNVFTLPASSYKVHAHLRIKHTHFQGLYWKHLGSAYHASSRFYAAGNLKSKRVRTHLLLCATKKKDHLWVKFRPDYPQECLELMRPHPHVHRYFFKQEFSTFALKKISVHIKSTDKGMHKQQVAI